MKQKHFIHDANLNNLQLQSSMQNEANIWVNQSANIIIHENTLKGKSNCFVKINGDKSTNISILNNIVKNVTSIYVLQIKK